MGRAGVGLPFFVITQSFTTQNSMLYHEEPIALQTLTLCHTHTMSGDPRCSFGTEKTKKVADENKKAGDNSRHNLNTS
jgi:hypothetical protein